MLFADGVDEVVRRTQHPPPLLPHSSTTVSAESAEETCVSRLNRGVRSSLRRLTSLGVQPFSGSLQLHRFALGNGLQIRIVPDLSAPVISYHTWFRVGSRQEVPGKTGLAHLFEHLMFNETKRLPYGEFDRVIEAAGGETNASTWTDFTQYHAELPASELGLIVGLEAQRMGELLLRDPQVSSEKEVVANERRYRVDDDVEGTAAELLYATAFRKHAYRFPTIGLMEDIEGFTTRDCRAFYRAYYAPNNAVLVIVGEVDLEPALALIQEHYGALRPGKLPPETRIKEPSQRAERAVSLRRQTPAPKLLLGYRSPPISHSDYVVLCVISDVLFGGRSSRLYRQLVRERELVTDLSGTIAPFQEPGLFEMWFSLRTDCEPEQVLALVDASIARLQHELVPEDELRRAANRYELGFLQSLETASGKADQIGFHEAILGDTAAMFTRLRAYRETQPERIREVARQYLQGHQRTRVTVLPSKDES